jgi:hypothetical protein
VGRDLGAASRRRRPREHHDPGPDHRRGLWPRPRPARDAGERRQRLLGRDHRLTKRAPAGPAVAALEDHGVGLEHGLRPAPRRRARRLDVGLDRRRPDARGDRSGGPLGVPRRLVDRQPLQRRRRGKRTRLRPPARRHPLRHEPAEPDELPAALGLHRPRDQRIPDALDEHDAALSRRRDPGPRAVPDLLLDRSRSQGPLAGLRPPQRRHRRPGPPLHLDQPPRDQGPLGTGDRHRHLAERDDVGRRSRALDRLRRRVHARAAVHHRHDRLHLPRRLGRLPGDGLPQIARRRTRRSASCSWTRRRSRRPRRIRSPGTT